MTLQAQPTWEAILLDWAYTALESPTHAPETGAEASQHTLDAAYRTCETITRENSRTFFIASGLLPLERRRAARALYAFCRVTDNIIDHAQGETPAVTRERLEAWRARSLDPNPPDDDPVALAWADARARYNIPTGYATQLIDGVARDLEQKRYATFDELAEYAYGVASTVGLMAMHIIGFSGEAAIPYAVKLGVALQITNILRDVQEDWLSGRVYLPQDELHHFGLSDRDLERGFGAMDDRWCAFMQFQIARVRGLYDEGYPGIALLHPAGRFAIAAASDLYRAILIDIERHHYDVFSRRSHVSTFGKLVMLPGIYQRSRRVKVK
ncbi:MAG: squalene/phytoene synthase family protein [bacterium]|nr:squalene/phytoene synthase family protein [bacterium]